MFIYSMTTAKKAALVTGAATGIGRSAALALARAGYDVAINYSSSEKAARDTAAAVEKLGAKTIVVRCDVSDEAGVRAMVKKVDEAFGRLDVLVNNAGVGIGAPIAEIDTKKLDIQLGVNLRSIILFYRESVELLRAAGAEHRRALVVNTASIAGKSGQPWLSVYSATKGAVVNFTEAMHKELAGDGIKSTALCPGFVDTSMTDFIKGQVPPEDMITPQDIAEAVRLLLKVSPACIIPEIQFIRPGDTG
jgi:NAD(P)-dependent dehydrogenase (short-subunit alcohol dehydrogenase family)